jgi:succinate dehydrogenase / fumarate reductase iron-sulfur subunit
MGTQRHFRVWRGDESGGDIQDYDVEVNEGEVVLDIMPRLGCMTRMSTFEEDETVTITPLRTFPIIRDLVTDVSFNYQKARETPAFAPPKNVAPGQYRMQQVDVERSQEFRKCIECFLCQNTCHVVRDHEENKQEFSGPRFFIRAAELDMHPLDARSDRKQYAQAHQGLGMCNITKCCTEVCPEHIKITDNAIIPMKERVVDRRYDPLVWLGRKIFRRDELEREQQPVFASARTGRDTDTDDIEVHTSGTPFTSARQGEAAAVNDDGKLDVSELAAPYQAAPSPFGDEQEFPLATGEFTYTPPSPEGDISDEH